MKAAGRRSAGGTLAPREILLVVPDSCLLLEAAGIADIFNEANELSGLAPPGPGALPAAFAASAQTTAARPYRVHAASTRHGRASRGRSGLSLRADFCLGELPPARERDTVIVTGRGSSPEERAAMAEWIRKAAPRARRVVSVCAGALVLAEAGLLDGLDATTHWLALDELEAGYPAVRVRRGPIFVRAGKVWTSAGASSGFDLALALVEEDMGHAVAKAVAQYLVMYLRRPGGQSQFSALLASQAPADGPVGEVQAWALEHLSEDLGVERLAERAAMSPRNFARVFARETGTTPARYVELARLEEARRRLEMGGESLGEVAAACGLGGDLGLRRLFERKLGVSPSEYRERFGRI